MKVAVGSTNPVKVGAAREVFRKMYGDEVEVVGVKVVSGVPAQPWGEEETIRGATNRATHALEEVPRASFGVGFEGGTVEKHGSTYECAWAVVARQDGVRGFGGGLYFELTPKMIEGLKEGKELGDVLDSLLSRENVKQQEGAIGVLTKGHLTRQQAYEHLLLQAMVKFIREDWY